MTDDTQSRSASRSTTRRCATARSSRASRSPSTTSCASPSSSTGSASHYIEAGWPGANPKDDEFFRRAADGAEARRRRRWWRSARPGASRARSTPTTRCATWSRPARRTVCIVGKSWDYHVHRGARAPRSTRAWRWSADSVEFLRGDGLRRVLRRRALLRRLQAQPRVRAARARGRGDERRVARSCCATPTAARCRTRSSAIVARGRRLLRRRRDGRACTSTTTPATRCRQRARRRARRRHAGAGHDQRLRRAHRQLQPHDDHPEPHAEDGHRDDPRATASSGSRRSRTTSPSS